MDTWTPLADKRPSVRLKEDKNPEKGQFREAKMATKTIGLTVGARQGMWRPGEAVEDGMFRDIEETYLFVRQIARNLRTPILFD